MTSSFMRSKLRQYQKTHPWAKKLPKNMVPKSRQSYDAQPIDLGTIDLSDVSAEKEAQYVDDGSWAIIYDTSRNGEWLWDLADNGWADHICSECRYTINTDIHVGIELSNCPRCGANMTKTHGITFTDDKIIIH